MQCVWAAEGCGPIGVGTGTCLIFSFSASVVLESAALEPRVLEPRVLEPRVLEPRVLDSRVLEPRVLEPRVLEPRVLEWGLSCSASEPSDSRPDSPAGEQTTNHINHIQRIGL